MKFKDMLYERPDIERLKETITDITNRFQNAKTYEEAKACFLEMDQLDRHVMTLSSIASTRHNINTKDEFYLKEEQFWNEAGPTLGEYTQRYTQALLATPFRKEFTEEYGDLMFVNGDIANRAFSPEIIQESIKENELVQEYENLLANARVNFEGKTYTLSEMSLFKSDPDDERRKEAWIADGTWYKENQERLDAIYDELVKLRTSMAKKLGHDNYIPLGYDRMGRNCYHEEEVDQFRKAVREYIVPITSKIYEAQAKRLGKEYPMSFADNELEFRSGNPRPKGTPDDILRAGKKFYDELSPETSKFFNIMLDNELLDVLSKEGKRGGGYCTGLPDYGVPFIFANFNGTQHDVEVVTHEAGHAFEAYTNINRVPSDYIWPSMEGAEVHSMSMEFFAEAWAEDFFGDDAKKFLYSHLAGALKFIPYGTLVDHFQHEVYRNPDMTPRERHDTWKRLMADYMPWEKLDGEIPFYADGEHWQLKHHIYSAPFYYIDYCLAQTVALQFWAMIQDDQKKAWDYYMSYTKLGGSMTFTDLLKTAGLESPFVLETIEKVMKKADTFLENYDLGDIK